jgi:hypothetical protein
LALRRRGAYITVKSVDTFAQQTEWNSGEKQAKFVKRFEELNLEPKRFDTRQRFDSEFAPGEVPGVPGMDPPQLTVNPVRMNPRQFRAYLERLREKRPAFIEYLRQRGLSDRRINNKTMYELAQMPDTDYHAHFLADETAESRKSLDSRVIDHSLHKTGGLIYSSPSPLQTFLTTNPMPGRVLMDAITYIAKQRQGYLVGYAGLTSLLEKRHATGDVKKMNWKKMDWKEGPERGVGLFRMNARLIALPAVVWKRQGVKGVKINSEVWSVLRGVDPKRSNTYFPGSSAYIAALPAPRAKKGAGLAEPANFTSPQKASQFERWQTRTSVSSTLETLKDMLVKDGEKK